MEIPVYLINGFLEGGKTTFIEETISDPGFLNGVRTLLILCEEGEVEYDEAALSKKMIDLVTVDSEDEFNEVFLNRCKDYYKPARVMIEYNGMWKVEDFLEMQMPKDWLMVQIITIINASTYNTYLTNMKSIMVGQFRYSDTIIFNRCDDNINKVDLRRSIKPVNRKGQIIYESENGITDNAGEEELPFDLEADIIEIYDDDYGLWFMDAMDNPKKYSGKTVKFLAMVYKTEKLPRHSFVPGRFAMTCCEDDVAFMGMLCKVEKDYIGPLQLDELKNREYIEITAKVRNEFYKEYRGKGPVLYAVNMERSDEPQERLVYFN